MDKENVYIQWNITQPQGHIMHSEISQAEKENYSIL